MCYIRCCVVLLLLVFNCSSETDVQKLESEPPLTDVLTLELSFGDEKTIDKNEYLLALPHGIIVANNGDIIVADESSMKVYDSSGKPKQIIGRPGIGPGEFGRDIILNITETGYISVINFDPIPLTYNLFNPDYTFLERKNLIYSNIRNKILKILDENICENVFFLGLYFYSPDERIIYAGAFGKRKLRNANTYFALFYEKDGQVTTIAKSVRKPDIESSTRDGALHSALLRDRKILYIHTGEHRSFENNTWFYTLNIYNLKTNTTETIKKSYVPVAIPDSVIYRESNIPPDLPEILKEQLKKSNNERIKELKEIGVYPPLQSIITDGDYIFAITYEIVKDKGLVVDVFDSVIGEYLCSAYFPAYKFITKPQFFPQFFTIKNGVAYYIDYNSEGFLVINKYRINPAVYGK